MKLKMILSGLVFFFLGHAGFTQVTEDYRQLDAYIQKALDDFEAPGLAVGIVKNGQVVLAKGYGYANNETKAPVDANTVFGIASCSKAFTAACISILVDEGKLHWEDKVVDLLPGFRLYDPYITDELTVRDLLCHRAGYETFDGDLLWYGTSYSREEVLRRFRYRKNPYSFREKFGYSNLMFITAGEVIKEVSGKTWDEFVKEKILDPLDMENTTTTNRGFDQRNNVAYPHLDGQVMNFINYDNAGPAATINSSVNDLLKWVNLLLQKGHLNDTVIFSEKQYYTMVSPQTILPAGKAEQAGGEHFSAYGLGWFLYDYKGMKVIHHSGGVPGFHAKVLFVPEDSLGFVILSNELGGLVGAVEHEILDYATGGPEKDWAKIYLDYVKKSKEQEKERVALLDSSRIAGTHPSLELAEYTGIYRDKMYGDAEIKLSDGELTVTLLPAKELFHSPMEHWHYDTFRIDFADPFLPAGLLTFHINERGVADYFTLDIHSGDFHFQKLKFERVAK